MCAVSTSGPDLERELGRSMFVYSGFERLISFEKKLFQTSRAEPERMNMVY